MRLSNRDGSPVDPVPFVVVALLSGLILVSWGPLYLKEHGVSEGFAVGVSVALSVVAVGVSYHRYVWTADPQVRQEVPAVERYRRLVYGIAIGVVVLLALVGLLHV
jgi:hypothetical protein